MKGFLAFLILVLQWAFFFIFGVAFGLYWCEMEKQSKELEKRYGKKRKRTSHK